VKIIVNKDSEIPLRDQLIEQIGLQIASGTLKGKEKLPSIRALADRLGIHYSTVTAAYNHLADTGLLDVRQGSGVRVAGRPPRQEDDQANLDTLVRDFLARATECNCSRDELRNRLQVVMSPRPVRRLIAVDRNQDFHELLVRELKPHFDVPIETMTVEQFLSASDVVADSLIITSLYHLFSFEDAVSDPTRLVVCNIEPAQAAIDAASSLPAGSLVALISVSPTIMRMATKLLASQRTDIGVRSLLVKETTEIEYVMKHADLIMCDISSEDVVKPLVGKKPMVTFRLYSPSTIQVIKDRLAKWG
jgi:DNA-binding transcriptional regulator YhcF (GntR family)